MSSITMSSYRELILATPDEATQEVLIALLDGLGFEGFVQESHAELKAYTAEPVDEAALADALQQQQTRMVSFAPVLDQNWNAVWEANYDSVAVDDYLLIYPEHRPPDEPTRQQYKHVLCVQPQMSFGTGHHATTRLMVRAMQDLDITGATVLDLGTGTGILGMLALRLGAGHVDLVDIDPLAVANSHENLLRNQMTSSPTAVRVWEGTADSLAADAQYTVVLANIHRNVLLGDAATLARVLAPGGYLLLSGFLDLDAAAIVANFQSLGLVPAGQWSEMGWVCCRMRRPV